MTLTLTIPAATPSMNLWCNKKRWMYAKLRARWYQAILKALLEAKDSQDHARLWPRPPQQQVCLVVDRWAPAHHTLDDDNFAGGLKPVIDALKKHRLIADDTRDALVTRPTQRTSQRDRWTVVTLHLDADDRGFQVAP